MIVNFKGLNLNVTLARFLFFSMYFPVGMEIQVTPHLLVVLPAGKTMVAAKLLCGCTNRPVGFKLISTWLTSDIKVYDITTVVACYFIQFLYHNAFVLYNIFYRIAITIDKSATAFRKKAGSRETNLWAPYD